MIIKREWKCKKLIKVKVGCSVLSIQKDRQIYINEVDGSLDNVLINFGGGNKDWFPKPFLNRNFEVVR